MTESATAAPIDLPDLVVRRNVLGVKQTTFAIGGPIQTLFEVNSIAGLTGLIKKLKAMGQAYLVLGAGSNLLIPDSGVALPVIQLGRGFRAVKSTGAGSYEVGGAYSLMSLSRQLSEDGLAGLEFAGGIPASFGGAIRMNAGAHGGELADVLRSVSFVSGDGDLVDVSAAELRFSYRHTSIPSDAIIIGAKIALVESDRDQVARRRAEYLAERKQRQPLTMPSAGSVFRNPDPKQSAGWLIEQAGLKGAVRGGARISEQHANWIVNPERKATASDVNQLISLCIEEVSSRTGIVLSPEVVRWHSL